MVDAAAPAPDSKTTLPPEQEQKVDFLAPRAGAKYVYVANPSRNTVSVIDSTTLAVSEKTPGDSPTYLATVPGQDVALVINVGSHTLRILRDAEDPKTDPIPIISKANAIAISPDGKHAVIWFDASQVAGSTTQATSAASTGSTQEVSVVNLSAVPETVFSLSVGYNPSAVVFSSDNKAAFVVTDDGISELRFANITADAIAPFTRIDQGGTSLARKDAGVTVGPDAQSLSPDLAPVGVPDGPPGNGGASSLDGGITSIDGGLLAIDGGNSILDGGPSSPDIAPIAPDLGPPAMPDAAPDTEPVSTTATSSASKGKPTDVSVTADGAYAVARRDGSSELLLVDLKTHTVTSLDLSSTITDLDLLDLPGSGSVAFAVLREESMLVRIDIPGGFTDPAHQPPPWQFPGETIGSVTMSSGGKYAVLYTTATPVKRLVIFDLATDIYQGLDLQRPIRALAIAPDQKTALVLHPVPATSGTGGISGAGGASGAADNGYGYTMVRLDYPAYAKWLDAAADPNPFAITPNSTHAFVLQRDDKKSVRIATRISLGSFIADSFPLGSPPNSVAALSEATHKVFVGQVHPEGRISFIDWVTGDVQSVTGFALNGRIQQ
jgi:YVTN family beta-propeller protein